MIADTVLVIDTETETIEDITATLESQGYLVFSASSKDDSITMAERFNPSLIYINLGMTSVSGLEICNNIHNSEVLKNVPIIIITTREGSINSRHTELYGIVDTLIKPFNPKELIEKTENVLAMKSDDGQSSPEEAGSIEEREETIEKAEEIPEIKNDITDKSVPPEDTSVDMTESAGSSDENTRNVLNGGDADSEENNGRTQITDQEVEKIERRYRDEEFLSKKRIIRRSKKNRLIAPMIVAAAILIFSVVGIMLFKSGFLPWANVKTPIEVKPKPSVQQQEAEIIPSREQEKQQQTIQEIKSTPVSAPEPKTTGKTVYHVQIGAFRNKNNAEALKNNYNKKGYEAFSQKGTTKDNKVIYRVLVGSFENRKESLKLADSIHAHEKIKVTVFTE
jgi:DNA-binding response OmpR family regulator